MSLKKAPVKGAGCPVQDFQSGNPRGPKCYAPQTTAAVLGETGIDLAKVGALFHFFSFKCADCEGSQRHDDCTSTGLIRVDSIGQTS